MPWGAAAQSQAVQRSPTPSCAAPVTSCPADATVYCHPTRATTDDPPRHMRHLNADECPSSWLPQTTPKQDPHCDWLPKRRCPDLVGPGANLTGAELHGRFLPMMDLQGTNLTNANLTGANLCPADLTDAVLTGAVFTGAELEGARLGNVALAGAVLTCANLSGISSGGVIGVPSAL